MTSKDAVKAQAQSLKSVLAGLGHDIPLGHALETVSRLAGARDWNAYCARLEDSPGLDEWLRSHVKETTTVRIRREPTSLRVTVRRGAAHLAERDFPALPDAAELFLTLQRAANAAACPLYLYEGQDVWRITAQDRPQEVFSVRGRRACYYIGHQDDRGHWIPSIVLEDEWGHSPTDWDYGADMQIAEAAVRQVNEARGVSEAEALDIVVSSMAAGARPDFFSEKD
ncbi:hypothetical protein D3C71_25960 [compost metagenome]